MDAIEAGKPTESSPKYPNRVKKGEQLALKHGLSPLKRAVSTLGNRALDKRTVTGKALAQWRDELVTALGGDPSPQEDCIIGLIVKTKLIKDSIDVWIMEQPTIINKRKKAVYPVVLQSQQMGDALARYVALLGLQRRTKLPSLSEILAPDDKPESSEQP